jgi:hypothetical protein
MTRLAAIFLLVGAGCNVVNSVTVPIEMAKAGVSTSSIILAFLGITILWAMGIHYGLRCWRLA